MVLEYCRLLRRLLSTGVIKLESTHLYGEALGTNEFESGPELGDDIAVDALCSLLQF